jgi:hypothetical protein
VSQARPWSAAGEGLRAAENREFEPRRVLPPNRISSAFPVVTGRCGHVRDGTETQARRTGKSLNRAASGSKDREPAPRTDAQWTRTAGHRVSSPPTEGGIEDAVDRRPRDAGQSVDLAAEGVASSNGYGDPIGASQAGRIAQAFRHPLSFAQVHMAGFLDDAGFCKDCNAPLLLPALARVRIRVRLLPPPPRQEPGPALVPVSGRSLDSRRLEPAADVPNSFKARLVLGYAQLPEPAHPSQNEAAYKGN